MKINIRSIFICMFALFTSVHFVSAQGTVIGIVTSDDQPEGLISATVVVGESGTVTEYDGSYELSLPAGEHSITISYTGYESYKETFTLADGEVKTLDVVLGYNDNLLTTATVTSSKFEKPLGEVTVSLEVIKPSFAEATNSTNVSQVLDRVPGVTMVDGQANIRGGSGFSYGAGSRVLLLVDNVPILSGDAGFPSWSDVPVENIAQVEVIKGAASALYGSSALNGIINIRTAYAKSEPETQVALYRDIFTAPNDPDKKWWAPDSISAPYKTGFQLVHRRKIDKLDLVLGTTGYLEKSYVQNSRDRKIRMNAKVRYRFNENLNAGFFTNMNFGTSNTVFLWEDNSAGAYSGDPQNLTNTKVKRYNIDPFINFTDKFGSTHRYIGRFYSTNNDNDNNQGNFSDNLYNEYQFQKKFEKIGLVTTAGVVNTNSTINGTLYGDVEMKSQNTAGYVQLEKKFLLSEDENKNVLNLTFGARYEFNSLDGPDTVFYVPGVLPDFVVLEDKVQESKPVFRVGASYQAAEFTYIRASWGQGYRFPSIAEKFIFTQVAGLFILPNPILESETGWSSEIGIKQGFKIANKIEGFVDYSVFWSEYSNMMEFNFTNDPFIGFQSKNVGGTIIRGTELSVTGRTVKGSKVPITFLLGYTFIDPKFNEFDESPIPYGDFDNIDGLTEGQLNEFFSTSEENVLKYRNRHSFKMDVEANIKENYFIGMSLNGASRIEAIDETLGSLAGINAYNDANNNGYAILDARLAYKPIESLKISLVGKNLLNKEYAARPGLLQPMRSISVRLDAKF